MRNEFARNLDLAQAKIQYDEQCKKVLGDKNVLSWILQRTVREYAGMNREEIMKCIEGEPEIGSRRVNPGETNASQITGMANEDKVNEEGTIFYDIRFFAWIPKSREKIRLIINVEAQKKYHTGYSLTTRAYSNRSNSRSQIASYASSQLSLIARNTRQSTPFLVAT